VGTREITSRLTLDECGQLKRDTLQPQLDSILSQPLTATEQLATPVTSGNNRILSGRLWVFTPDTFEIRHMAKRWGSCTPEGKILLNLKLIQVPKGLIDYVVMHELCHLKEHHHGAAFYNLLGRAMPDWQERRQQLNEMDVA
jgi:predicted metal-dependent hydrolase